MFGADAELGEVLVGKKMAEFTDNGLQRVQAVKEKLLEKFRSRIKDLEDDNQAEVEDDGFDSDEFDFDLGPTYEDLIRKFQDSKVSGTLINLCAVFVLLILMVYEKSSILFCNDLQGRS